MSEDDREAPDQPSGSRHVRRPRPHGRRARRIDPAAEPGADPAAEPGAPSVGAVPARSDEQRRALEEARHALRVRRGEDTFPAAPSETGSSTSADADLPRTHRAAAPRSGSEPAPEPPPAPQPQELGPADAHESADHRHEAEAETEPHPGSFHPAVHGARPDEVDDLDDHERVDAIREDDEEVVDDERDDEDDAHPFAGFEHEQKRRSPLHILPILLVLVVVLAVGAGAVYGYSWLRGNVNVDQAQDDDYTGTGSDEEVVIEIAEGDTGSDIASTLVDKGVIKSAPPFVRLFGTSQEASKIQPGSYRVNTKMSSASALEALLDPSSQTGLRVTIPEGMRMKDIFERISKTTGIPEKDFEKAAKNYTDYGIPKNRANSPEGYLWPGRYDIPEDASAGDVLTMMWERMETELDDLGVAPEDREKVLTLASIAEKEARDPDDYGRVVRTLENRLDGAGDAHGKPMKLQLDSTVAYFSGSDSISTTPKQRETDSPYNTYLHEGLPVGPISNPGKATLEAAADPPQGKWLYWVTVDTSTGETKFADTYAEHEKNVAEWKKRAATKDADG
ncbi:endolytic transglycosylase MltG [Brachybacterium sp. MASK1Z-5]|uniref:Endolytic murein transglycosylase n=1 Tax=Brachybacterium halotolerans TaxID=2795215 RepID=A0ABS1B760_9MICO|nr:endolytic transglycosylase MltG [Brachybacterium halotolerans]MBK0330072.1 endolytic transglycosylase MltG [Brachybacterium halotolerans]